MKANNQLLLLRSESASSNIRPQIINPSQTTTLTTPLKPWKIYHNQNPNIINSINYWLINWIRTSTYIVKERFIERKREKKILTCFLRNFTPAAITMGGDVSNELLIFLRWPKASLNLLLVAARVVTHIDSPSWISISCVNIFVHLINPSWGGINS